MKRSFIVAAVVFSQIGAVGLSSRSPFPRSAGSAVLASDATVSDGFTPSAAVKVAGVRFEGGSVRGTIVNTSPTEIGDVQLLIRYVWLWKDERHPGDDNPGRSEFHVVHETIEPGGSVAFEKTPDAPLPLSRTDGRFQAEVSVVGFTQVER
jgi:hypothetical protein